MYPPCIYKFNGVLVSPVHTSKMISTTIYVKSKTVFLKKNLIYKKGDNFNMLGRQVFYYTELVIMNPQEDITCFKILLRDNICSIFPNTIEALPFS